MQKNLLTKVDPIYPAEAQRNHIGGTVVLQTTIGTDGIPTDLRVVSGPTVLRDAALEAVRQWRYKAYILNGNEVAVQTIILINFNLTA